MPVPEQGIIQPVGILDFFTERRPVLPCMAVLECNSQDRRAYNSLNNKADLYCCNESPDVVMCNIVKAPLVKYEVLQKT
jgi:hypothetical protein